VLLFWYIRYHLKNYIFNRSDHYLLKRGEALIEVFDDGKVVESQFFGDFVLEGVLCFFLEGSIVSFEHLEKIVMGEIRYDGGFFVRDGSGSVSGGRMDAACFFLCLSFFFAYGWKSVNIVDIV